MTAAQDNSILAETLSNFCETSMRDKGVETISLGKKENDSIALSAACSPDGLLPIFVQASQQAIDFITASDGASKLDQVMPSDGLLGATVSNSITLNVSPSAFYLATNYFITSACHKGLDLSVDSDLDLTPALYALADITRRPIVDTEDVGAASSVSPKI